MCSIAPRILFLRAVPFLTFTLKIPLYFSTFLIDAFFKFVCIKVVFENCSFLTSKKSIQKDKIFFCARDILMSNRLDKPGFNAVPAKNFYASHNTIK